MSEPSQRASDAAPRLCVLGSINMDLVVSSPALPRPGETLLGGPFATHPGGKGANQAVAAARFGAEVAMLGWIGEDEFGEKLLWGLREEDIDCLGVTSDTEEHTGIAMITVDAQGENTIVVAPGANAAFPAHEFDELIRVWRDADALLLQLEVPLATVSHAARRAHAAGLRVILNAAPAQPLPNELLQAVDVLIVNRGEAITLLGDERDDHALLTGLRELGPRTVVLTRGAEGALALAEGLDTPLEQASFSVDPVDTVGAGDAFAGVLATALAEGRELGEALRLGCAAGALATTVAGAQPALPGRDAVLALAEP